jgi:hypothetical protein
VKYLFLKILTNIQTSTRCQASFVHKTKPTLTRELQPPPRSYATKTLKNLCITDLTYKGSQFLYNYLFSLLFLLYLHCAHSNDFSFSNFRSRSMRKSSLSRNTDALNPNPKLRESKKERLLRSVAMPKFLHQTTNVPKERSQPSNTYPSAFL